MIMDPVSVLQQNPGASDTQILGLGPSRDMGA